MWFFLSLAVEGALAGAVYALIVLPFVLVYKASGMVNFALGEWIMLGALLAGIGLHLLQLGSVGLLPSPPWPCWRSPPCSAASWCAV